MNIERLKGIIFDYGATLDTDGCHWGVMFIRAYRNLGINIPETTLREAYVYAERTMGKRQFIMATDTFRTTLATKISLQLDFLKQNGIQLPYCKCAQDLLNLLYGEVTDKMVMTRKVLTGLSEYYPMVLVSNFYGNIHTVLKEFGIQQFFIHVIESALVGIRKPDPEIFALGAQALNAETNQIIVVGDCLEKDIIPAHSIGFSTIWLRGEGWTPYPQNTPEADVIIRHLNGILDILLPLNQTTQTINSYNYHGR